MTLGAGGGCCGNCTHCLNVTVSRPKSPGDLHPCWAGEYQYHQRLQSSVCPPWTHNLRHWSTKGGGQYNLDQCWWWWTPAAVARAGGGKARVPDGSHPAPAQRGKAGRGSGCTGEHSHFLVTSYSAMAGSFTPVLLIMKTILYNPLWTVRTYMSIQFSLNFPAPLHS